MEINENKMRPRSLSARGHFTRVYLHAQTSVHMHLMNHFLIARKNKYSQLVPYADDEGSQISDLYLWYRHVYLAPVYTLCKVRFWHKF